MNFPARNMTARMPMNTAGSRIVVILKVLPRICSIYSRWATSHTLRIDLFSYRADKNLFQRRLHQLEPIDHGFLHRRPQQILRVGVLMQLNGRLTAVIPKALHRSVMQETRIAFKIDDDAIALVARLHLAHASGKHGTTVVNQTDR